MAFYPKCTMICYFLSFNRQNSKSRRISNLFTHFYRLFTLPVFFCLLQFVYKYKIIIPPGIQTGSCWKRSSEIIIHSNSVWCENALPSLEYYNTYYKEYLFYCSKGRPIFLAGLLFLICMQNYDFRTASKVKLWIVATLNHKGAHKTTDDVYSLMHFIFEY